MLKVVMLFSCDACCIVNGMIVDVVAVAAVWLLIRLEMNM
jgi:hypothetical protein